MSMLQAFEAFSVKAGSDGRFDGRHFTAVVDSVN